MKQVNVYISILSLCLAFTSCKRSLEVGEIYGSEYKPAPSDFSVQGDSIGSSGEQVDFSVEKLNFEATFSHEVSWYLEIKGISSGATKNFEGIDNNLSDLNTEWDGGTDNVRFFTTELCVATLTFWGSEIVITDTIQIIGLKQYHNQTFDGVSYTVITDFDGAGVSLSGSADALDENTSFMNYGTDYVQGTNSYFMSGTDASNNGWIGGAGTPQLKEIALFNLTPTFTDPKQVYINLYIYGTGQSNTTLQIKVHEVDDQTNFDNITSYSYNQADNDTWINNIQVNWTGWKLVSVRYSDFITNWDSGPNGNKTREPHKLSGLNLSLLSLPQSGSNAELIIDFVTITEGGRFIP